MIIHSYENSRRADACTEYLRRSKIKDCVEGIIMLPIPSTRDKTTILGTKIYIKDVIELADAYNPIIGYLLPDDIKEELTELQKPFHDVADDEDFLLKNARLTAEAALGIILTSSRKAISDMRIGVVGYGRIGKALSRLLLYLGAHACVYTTSPSTLVNLAEAGIETVMCDDDAELLGVDILVNTAPAKLFDSARINAELADIRIIDLASGDNFPSSVSVEKYPSIPAKMFPESSGKIWGISIEKFITGKYSRERG